MSRALPSHSGRSSTVRRRGPQNIRPRAIVGLLVLSIVASGAWWCHAVGNSQSGYHLAAAIRSVDSTSTSTRVVFVDPVNEHGSLATGYAVANRERGTCHVGSSVVAGAAYRCFHATAVLDPCWAESARSQTTDAAVCLAHPWSTRVTLLTVQPLPRSEPSRTNFDDPWGVQLRNHSRCDVSSGSPTALTGPASNALCLSRGTALLSPISRSSKVWSYRSLHCSKKSCRPARPAAIATAWFGGPPPPTYTSNADQVTGLGDPVTFASNGEQVTADQVVDPAQKATYAPLGVGRTFAAVIMTVANRGTHPVSGNGAFDTSVIASDGQTYLPDSYAGEVTQCSQMNQEIELAPGASTTACVAIQIPASTSIRTVLWSPTGGQSGDTGRWHVSPRLASASG